MCFRKIFPGSLIVVCALSLFAEVLFGATAYLAFAKDVGSRVETLGNPGRNFYPDKSPAFARSFEYLNGAFYFGLGCEAELNEAIAWAEKNPPEDTNFEKLEDRIK